MKTLFFLCIGFWLMKGVLSHPAKGQPLPTHQNCIQLTPEKEAEINLFVEKISNFFLNLTAEHEEFDVTFIKVDIERHSNDEDDEKEIELQLSVNDCAKSDEIFEKDTHFKVRERNINNEPKKDGHIDKPVKKPSNDDKKGYLIHETQQNITGSHKDFEKRNQKANNSNGKIIVNPEPNSRNDGDVNKNSGKTHHKTHEEKNQQNEVSCDVNKYSDEQRKIGSVESDGLNKNDDKRVGGEIYFCDCEDDDGVEREPNITAPEVIELNLGSNIEKLLKEIEKKKGNAGNPLLVLFQEHEDYVILN